MKKKIKVVKKTTCNVLIRDFPVEISEAVKVSTGEKCLSKALISVSRRYLELKKSYDELQEKHYKLQSNTRELDNAVQRYLGSLDTLRTLVTDGAESDNDGNNENQDDDDLS